NLSKAARSVAIPSLEIDQPDCRRAAHSSSVGPIDETQLFYLESRGIPPDEARKFIVLGFLVPGGGRAAPAPRPGEGGGGPRGGGGGPPPPPATTSAAATRFDDRRRRPRRRS